MTITAFSAQQKVTDQRDIVVKLDGSFAVRAMRTRKDDRLFFGQSDDTDIEKTANHRSKYN
jgi:hypothetical protein